MFAQSNQGDLCSLTKSMDIIEYTEDPRYNDSICPQDFAVKKNLSQYKIPTCTSIINDKKPFPLIYSKKYMLWIFVRIVSVAQ